MQGVFFIAKKKGGHPMSQNTHIFNRFTGYSTADCACRFCLHYRGKKRACSLEACCCDDIRQEAQRREKAA